MTEYVYYLRRNGLIKIGYSASLASRMYTLRPDELLAIEPGNKKLERARHIQFRALRVSGINPGVEWFAPEPELLDHIENMAALYPTPDLTELVRSRPRSQPRTDAKPLNMRLDPEVRRRLDEFATRTHRTITASMNMLLTEALDAVDEANATDRRVQS